MVGCCFGGAILVSIAHRLRVPVGGDDGHNVASTNTFWGAMKTIIVADASAGLDNVLGARKFPARVAWAPDKQLRGACVPARL